MIETDPGTVDADNPWPGLASFREADRELFYGRETETQEVLRLALRERLTVLFGLSGLGKTSLLRAGLFPLLRQENVLPVYVRLDFSGTGTGLIDQVRQAILREAEAADVETPAFPATETLWESLHRQGAELWNPRNRIVTPLLVFDQFEEVFTLGRASPARMQESEVFLTELADLCEGSAPASVRARLEADPAAARELSFTRHPYKILLSLREDFLPELEGLRGRIRSIIQNRFRLRRMNGGNALRVITQAGGHLVEPDVPERVVRFVAGRESDGTIPLADLEIEPSLLSVVCRELNNKRRAQGLPRITAGLVQGNRDEILTDLYERSINDLGPDVRSFVEERLLTKSGFRDTMALENAIELPGVTLEALNKLTDRRLLRIDDRGDRTQRLELTHDVLTGVIRRSRDHRREEEAREREEEARRQAERRLRRSSLIIALLLLVLLGVVALAGWGLRAERQARAALASSDAERAWNLRDTTPAHALAHLARALRLEPKNVPAQTLLTDLLLDRTWLRPVQVFESPQEKVIDLSEDGRRFATLRRNGTLQVRDTRTFQPVGRPIPFSRNRDVPNIQWGGERLLIQPGRRLWDLRTGREIPSLLPPETGGSREILSPDGRWMIEALRDGTVTFWEIDQGETVEIHVPISIEETAFSSDGRKLFIYNNSSVVAWDLTSRHEAVLRSPQPFSYLAVSPDGGTVMTGGFGSILWDTVSGQATPNPLPQGEIYGAPEIVLSPDGERVLVVSESMDEVHVWSLLSPGKPLATVSTGVDFSDIELSPDGQLVLAMARDQVILLNVYGGQRTAEVLCDCNAARFLDGAQQIVTVDRGGSLQVWSFAAARTGTEFFPPGSALTSFSQDGSRIALASVNEIRVLDTDSGKPIGEPLPTPNQSLKTWLSPDGRFLAAVGPSEVSVWDTRTNELAWPSRKIDGGVSASLSKPFLSAISSDGRTLVTLNENRTVDLWNLQTGQKAGALAAGAPLVDFMMSPAGDRIATLSGKGIVQLWSLPEGKSLAVSFQQPQPVFSLHFSEDGRRLATATRDGNAWIWDAESGERLVGPLSHPRIAEVRFGQGGRLLLTWSPHGVVIWDSGTGRATTRRISVNKVIRSAQLSPDGARLIVHQIDDGSILVFDARTGWQIRSPIELKSAGAMDLSDVRLSPSGNLLWDASENQLHVLALPTFPARDADLLARWAEAAGGYRLDEESQLIPVSGQIARLEALRRETADAPQDELTAASLIRWFFDDPIQRGISPVVHRTAEDYLRFYLEPKASYLWDDGAAPAFPGHPLFRKFPRPPTPMDFY